MNYELPFSGGGLRKNEGASLLARPVLFLWLFCAYMPTNFAPQISRAAPSRMR